MIRLKAMTLAEFISPPQKVNRCFLPDGLFFIDFVADTPKISIGLINAGIVAPRTESRMILAFIAVFPAPLAPFPVEPFPFNFLPLFRR